MFPAIVAAETIGDVRASVRSLGSVELLPRIEWRRRLRSELVDECLADTAIRCGARRLNLHGSGWRSSEATGCLIPLGWRKLILRNSAIL
ncbi:MAG: hypothetical protein FD138_4523 [Planctomycetota bacterium]|nr:MAG: hypothetical protein FD138_4523 [Planctomycetota bacterium]